MKDTWQTVYEQLKILKIEIVEEHLSESDFSELYNQVKL